MKVDKKKLKKDHDSFMKYLNEAFKESDDADIALKTMTMSRFATVVTLERFGFVEAMHLVDMMYEEIMDKVKKTEQNIVNGEV